MSSKNPALNDKFAKHLGIEVVSFDDGHARVRLSAAPHFLNGAGLVHGGVLFTLADYAFALTANAGEAPGLGINSNMNFIKAARPGDELFAEATLVSRSRKLGTYRLQVTDRDGAMLACGQAMAYFKD